MQKNKPNQCTERHRHRSIILWVVLLSAVINLLVIAVNWDEERHRIKYRKKEKKATSKWAINIKAAPEWGSKNETVASWLHGQKKVSIYWVSRMKWNDLDCNLICFRKLLYFSLRIYCCMRLRMKKESTNGRRSVDKVEWWILFYFYFFGSIKIIIMQNRIRIVYNRVYWNDGRGDISICR